MFRVTSVSLSLFMLVAALPVSAHHSNIIFDRDTEITIRGAVTRYVWRNPHVYIYVESPNDTGGMSEWQIEADPTPIMARSGWGPDSLAPGDPVIVRGYPDRTAPDEHALLISLARPDGVLLTMRTGGRDAPAAAESITGRWDGVRGSFTRTFNYGRLTEKGSRAQAEYDESMNPVIDCIAYPLPTIVSSPYMFEVEVLDDRVLVRTEFYNVERTIWTDGRGHPENGEPTTQGHSIGWWEDDVLVVDTTQFTEYRAGNRSGIPSGLQKHVTERYSLSEDRTQLNIEYVVDDPEYMAEPMEGHIFWDYAPDREFLPFGCDSENARLYAID
ncbi:MAG: hypothetical protein GWN29_08055 [Gammaproteobacteria bacterium]|nr:hypothetical protein [Gammaproteobacteria bacterium]